LKKISTKIDDVEVQGLAARSGSTLWLHLDGETFSVELPVGGRRRGKAASATANPNILSAPMPGKIIKLMAKVGQQVAPGEVVLVMEAMKMEYTLKAQTAAVVEAIDCEPGQQVVLGQILVKLEVKGE
jgi:biotin carboxyl carrier protein